MENKFETLKRKYGSHQSAAGALGITRRTYYSYRNRAEPLPKVISMAIDMLVGQASSTPRPAASGDSTGHSDELTASE